MHTQSLRDKGHSEAPAEAGDLARDLVETFGRMTPYWIKWLHRTAEPAGLTPARLRVLGTLVREGPSIMHHLSDELGVTPRAITGLIDGLEEDGLVERQRHPSDRRATVIALTDQGRKVTESWWDEHIDRTSEIFGALGERDQRTLLRILRKMEGPLAERLA
jgi:DNA-binding MarR family transcriptional regulator